MATISHRHSISKRSSVQQIQTQPSVPTKGKRVSSRSGPNDVKTTMSRLEYLNSKFNKDPSFDIEISGDEEDDEDGQNNSHDVNNNKNRKIDVQFDSKLMDIDILSKESNINQMEFSLDISISLLSPLFQYIQDFETNLDTLSNEMEILQSRLVDLNDEIKKNTIIDNQLTPILTDLLIPPQCIKILLNGKIDIKWVDQLTIIQEKREILMVYKTKEKVSSTNITELVSIIDKLEIKCIERIKRFMIDNIKQLRGTTTSSVKIQSRLLQVKEIFVFLKSKNNKLSKELETAYVYTMRWYYYFNFVKYISSLEGLKVLENDYDVDKKSISSSTASSTYQRSLLLDNTDLINEYLINLPKRLEKMADDNSNQYSILGQIAESTGINGMKFNMEQIFLFLNQAMMDNLTIEFNFIVEFFVLTNNDDMNNLIKQIFSPILRMGSNFTTYLLTNCKSDYFGILLTIRRIQRMEYEIQNRCLPELFDNYLNTQLLTLWPIFQRDIDVLCTSITQTLSSTSIIKYVVNSKNNILIPLKITQSFSMVLSNLLKLVQNLVFELETSEPLKGSIERLSNTFERGMVQLGGSLDEGKGKRKLFLYVNFQLVYNVLDNEMGTFSASAIKKAKNGSSTHFPTAPSVEDDTIGETTTVGEGLCKHYEQLVQAYT
ncbi:hypothetical protein C6P40_005094 [Pichia californica]|uniref:Vacuolar protein sorting-associated protein 52 n=1 Tax=Pichia californica TaxID=460514 RepID=A0A9P7BHG8_9ASCO|nr:hypothetical protein C6P40_005094 [[Candida] californica]